MHWLAYQDMGGVDITIADWRSKDKNETFNEEKVEDLELNIANAETPDDARNMLGDYLYPLIVSEGGHSSEKITGMLLDLGNTKVFDLIRSPDSLRQTIAKAFRVLSDADGGDHPEPTEVTVCDIPCQLAVEEKFGIELPTLGGSYMWELNTNLARCIIKSTCGRHLYLSRHYVERCVRYTSAGIVPEPINSFLKDVGYEHTWDFPRPTPFELEVNKDVFWEFVATFPRWDEY